MLRMVRAVWREGVRVFVHVRGFVEFEVGRAGREKGKDGSSDTKVEVWMACNF